MNFAHSLAALRKDAGISQEQLADALGYRTQSRIGNYESGKRQPKPDELPRIAKALGTTVGAFFGEAATVGPKNAPEESLQLDAEVLGDAIEMLRKSERRTAHRDLTLAELQERPDVLVDAYRHLWAVGMGKKKTATKPAQGAHDEVRRTGEVSSDEDARKGVGARPKRRNQAP